MSEFTSICEDANRIAAQLRGRQPLTKKVVVSSKYVRPSRAYTKGATGRAEFLRAATRATGPALIAFCREFFEAHDQLPPQEFIAKHFGISGPTANKHMRYLGAAGHLERNAAGKWRFARAKA